MSDRMPPDLHPDLDSLNAFLAGALPEQEREQCLAHLAECSQCRELVYLAQDVPAAPVPAMAPVPFWRRWFAPVPALAAAAALGIAMVAWFARPPRPVAPAPDTVARNTGVPKTPPPAAIVERKAEPRRPAPQTKQHTPAMPAPAPEVPPLPPTPFPAPVIQPPPPPAVIREELAASPTGISGTVTDATGAVIPGATVQVRQLDGNASLEARTDAGGQFRFVDLAPGRYRLVIESPGFRAASSQIEVRDRELASADSRLEVGSVAETVEVTAAVPVLETQTSSASGKAPRPLPSKLPVVDMLASGKRLLAVDSAGALFVSGNWGKGWRRVKPVWPGSIRSLALGEPPVTFQLTTDSGAVWQSRDGARWQPVASPPR